MTLKQSVLAGLEAAVPTTLSGVMGTLSILCWIVVFTPQLYENYQLKSAKGLSLLFLTIWLVADLASLAGVMAYTKIHTVVFLTVYYASCEVVMFVQYFFYARFEFLAICNDHREQSSGRTPFVMAPTSASSLEEDDESHGQMANTNNNNASNSNSRNKINNNNYVNDGSESDNVDNNNNYNDETDSDSISTANLISATRETVTSDYSDSMSSVGSKNRNKSNETQLPLDANGNLDWSHLSYVDRVLVTDAVISLTNYQFLALLTAVFTVGYLLILAVMFLTCWPLDSELIGGFFGYLSAVLYIGARIPQIIKNYRSRSTQGLQPLMFILSVLGNVTFSLSLVFSTIPIRTNAPWIAGSAGTLLFDFMVLFQVYLYKENSAPQAIAI